MSNTRVSGLGTARHTGSAGKKSAESAAASSWSTLFDAAKLVGSVAGGAGSGAASPWSTLFQAAKVVLGVRAALQAVGIDVVALLRRRGPLGAVSVFGAGFAVGAGVGALLAPTTGKVARRTLRRRFRELRREALGQVEKVGAEVQDLEQQVEEKAGEVVEAVKIKAESITSDVKETADRAKPIAPRKRSASASGATRGDGTRSHNGHTPIKGPHFFG